MTTKRDASFNTWKAFKFVLHALRIYFTKVISWKIRIFVLPPSFQRRKLRVEVWGYFSIWKQKYILFAAIPIDSECADFEQFHSINDPVVLSYAYWKVFFCHSFWSVILYMKKLWFLFAFWAIKPRMQTSFKYSIYMWTLSHLNSPNCRFTKRTIAYSNPPASCLSPRLKSTGKNLGETEVFNAVRRGFAEVKLQIKTAIRPRQNRGKWSHSFERYCIPLALLAMILNKSTLT